MKIAFCTPFKSIDHPRISGDVTIARDLLDTLRGFGHEVVVVDHFPAKKIDQKPGHWFGAWVAGRKMVEQARGVDCWLTYNSYYKVPDIFGPTAARRLGIPYFIFQASYAEDRGKRLATWPGYWLNRRAMLRADHIFCNRVNDVEGCAKLLPTNRYSYVKPGLPRHMFKRDEAARAQLRAEWGVGETPIVMTAAVMRPGVKAEGVRWVIETCADLARDNRDFKLVIAGDGPQRVEMEAFAQEQLGERVLFLGMVERTKLSGVFSAGDVFAFPGLEESVGMVYLEAQQCGLPVVATDDEGAPHVVAHERSGIITPTTKEDFSEGVKKLVLHTEYRNKLGRQAVEYVQQNHLAQTNYREVERIMERIVGKARQ